MEKAHSFKVLGGIMYKRTSWDHHNIFSCGKQREIYHVETLLEKVGVVYIERFQYEAFEIDEFKKAQILAFVWFWTCTVFIPKCKRFVFKLTSK